MTTGARGLPGTALPACRVQLTEPWRRAQEDLRTEDLPTVLSAVRAASTGQRATADVEPQQVQASASSSSPFFQLGISRRMLVRLWDMSFCLGQVHAGYMNHDAVACMHADCMLTDQAANPPLL